jgi:hypothetical protein
MFFTFPEDARWSAERQAVEFGVVIGEYEGRSGPLPSGVSRRTTYSGPGSRASPRGSCGGASWPRMGMWRSPGATCANAHAHARV